MEELPEAVADDAAEVPEVDEEPDEGVRVREEADRHETEVGEEPEEAPEGSERASGGGEGGTRGGPESRESDLSPSPGATATIDHEKQISAQVGLEPRWAMRTDNLTGRARESVLSGMYAGEDGELQTEEGWQVGPTPFSYPSIL